MYEEIGQDGNPANEPVDQDRPSRTDPSDDEQAQSDKRAQAQSDKRAQAQSDKRAQAQSLAGQIAALEAKISSTPLPDDPLGEEGRSYDELIAAYQQQIADCRARLLQLNPSAAG